MTVSYLDYLEDKGVKVHSSLLLIDRSMDEFDMYHVGQLNYLGNSCPKEN